MGRLWTLLLALLSTSLALGADAPAAKRLATANDAYEWALGDVKRLPADAPQFTRYLWFADADLESAKVGSLTMNYVSRSSVIQRPPPTGMLLRIDLRKYAPRDADLAEWLKLWEEFQFDPTFSTLITKDSIDLVLRNGGELPGVVKAGKRKILVKTAPYEQDGETLTEKWVDLIRLTGRHLDQTTAAELQKLTGSSAPVVESRYFTFRALSTVKDAGVYKEVFGGLYYELAGIKRAKDAGKKKATDEDLLFEAVGIGDVDKGLTAKAIFDRARSDQRVAMFRSNVTGKPRRVDVLPALLKGSGAAGFIMTTHDIGDADIDVGQHPMMSLVDFKDKARETIFTRANGLHGFALFNGAGALQDEAPPDVVKDHTIPPPHTARLQGAISCLRCHGTDGSDGLKPLVNDVQMLRKGYLDVFGDVGGENKDKAIPDVLDRLAGLYAGSPDKTLRRGREDYIEAILRATGPWKAGKDQTEVGKITASRYEALWKEYVYETVDAHKALREMGYEVPREKAVEAFRKIVPPDRNSRAAGFIAEDPRIGALAMGLSISRTDWSLVYSFAATRALQNKALQNSKATKANTGDKK